MKLRRNAPGDVFGISRAADLDGDGRDEFLVWNAQRMHVYDLELNELWSGPDPSPYFQTILPASAGQAARVMLSSGRFVNGKTGRPIWMAQPPMIFQQNSAILLDPGDAGRPPLLLNYPTNGTTVAASALASNDEGRPAPPRGSPTPAGYPTEDPRWTRDLPWVGPILHSLGFKGLVVLVGLAVVNVLAPLGIVWLASRRRAWSILTLMSLPVAAAVPLSVFQTVEPLVPAQLGTVAISPRLVFALSTIAGIPIVVLLAAAGWWLVRLRWRKLLGLLALVALASAAVAGTWIAYDVRTMPAIEHYGRPRWPLALVPGAYAAGLLILLGWPIQRALRWLRRPRPTGPANP